MLRRLLTLGNSNTLQILWATRQIGKTATRVQTQQRLTPVVVKRGNAQLVNRGRQVETKVVGKINKKSIVNNKGAVRNVKNKSQTTRNKATVEKKKAVRTKNTVAVSSQRQRKTTERKTGKETKRKRPHAHAVQKMKYNKRVAAIAKLWRMQKKKNTSKTLTKLGKK
ncbi:uncharacterized protein TM35_000342090 [Trypanosoma theileri]|uniref:Uncharacterized protein n=1 Tax=Trypanosoma theileri TaxID=67003 RepID=A0A1X0NLQ5_9TRYP|nr:uncharacterized protein TM35_000342090 [Trypanosoma theileri]ORC85597.1 hypothetical protein TM35_000342090 [Trypanosoma theileri]